MNAAVAGRDYQALLDLRTLRADRDRLAVGVDAATRQRYASQLDARSVSLLGELLAAERAAMNAHGAGAASLVQDAEWHASFRERFVSRFGTNVIKRAVSLGSVYLTGKLTRQVGN